jgi:hypothetical protein
MRKTSDESITNYRLPITNHKSQIDHRKSPIRFACLIHVYRALGLLDHFGGFWHVVGLWNLEQLAALGAANPSVCCAILKQPSTAAPRAFGNYLHQKK